MPGGVDRLFGRGLTRVRRNVLVAAVAFALSLVTAWQLAGNGAEARHLLTKQQEALVEAKAAAAKAAGIEYNPGGAVQVTGPRPYRASFERVRLTRQQVAADFRASFARMEDELSVVEDTEGPEAAAAIRRQIEEAALRSIDAIPPEGIDLELPTVEIGTDSIQFSTFTYPTNWDMSDPVNLVFYGPAGSDWER